MLTTSTVSSKLLFSVAVSISVITSVSYWFYKLFTKDVMPTKWRRVGTLEQLHIFPVKSCAPLKLNADEELSCEILGLRMQGLLDRALMIVNDKYELVTARAYPKMVLIETKLLGPTKLSLSATNMTNKLEVDFATLNNQADSSKKVKTAVFGSHLTAMLCGDIYDKWFSECLLNEKSGLHLLYFPHKQPVRAITSDMIKEAFITRKDTGTFGDATSYMLMNLSSIDDLNTRIPNPVNPLQFRGNFYLKMDQPEPYAEDNWNWIRIGNDAIFRIVAPCTRCILPNINVFTGERDQNGEPLRTLKTYRKHENYASPPLGVHMGLRLPGSIKVNDSIYVEEE